LDIYPFLEISLIYFQKVKKENNKTKWFVIL